MSGMVCYKMLQSFSCLILFCCVLSFTVTFARAAVVSSCWVKGEEKDYKAETPRREKRLQTKWRPHGEREKKKTTDEAKTPWRRKRLKGWDPTEKKRLQSEDPNEKKKTTDEAKTPQRRKRLQMKPKLHGEEKDYRWNQNPTEKKKTTKLRPHRKEKTTDKAKTPRWKKRLQRWQTKWRPYGEEDYRQAETPPSLVLPRSMWMSSAVLQSIKMFITWRSPSPRM